MRCNAIVLDLLAVMRGVGFAVAAIEIALAHDFRRRPSRARDAIDEFPR